MYLELCMHEVNIPLLKKEIKINDKNKKEKKLKMTFSLYRLIVNNSHFLWKLNSVIISPSHLIIGQIITCSYIYVNIM